MSDLILYTSDDGRTRMQLRIDEQTIWLTRLEIAELFQTTKQNVSLHANNLFKEGELHPDSVVKESLTTASDGKQYRTQHYNLDLILAIGYRVRSPRGTQFRQWATTHLREFLVKGFVIDDERLKHSGGWDYFDELLERIRDIRASEKRFYQKVRDLFKQQKDLTLDFWRKNLDKMLEFNDQAVLGNLGAVSHATMTRIAHERYAAFDQSRRAAEALAADAEDLKQIEQLERRLKTKKL